MRVVLLCVLCLLCTASHAQTVPAPTCPSTSQNSHAMTWMGSSPVIVQWCVTGTAIQWWAGVFDVTKLACTRGWSCLQPTSPDNEIPVHILLKRWLPRLVDGQITYPPAYGWNHDRTPS
jgi:hypothetical protein